MKSILVSQSPPPKESSPYRSLEEKYSVSFDFVKFFEVSTIKTKSFLKQNIALEDYGGVIFTSKIAIDSYFELAQQVRYKVSPENKYFCLSEKLAYYLQKYVVFRKRKIYFGNNKIQDLTEYLEKFKGQTQYLLPSSKNILNHDIPNFLDKLDLKWSRAVFFKNVRKDLDFLKEKKYDMIALFSPADMKSLFKNFPDFQQKELILATFGTPTFEAAVEKGLQVHIKVPAPQSPSMVDAIENYIIQNSQK